LEDSQQVLKSVQGTPGTQDLFTVNRRQITTRFLSLPKEHLKLHRIMDDHLIVHTFVNRPFSTIPLGIMLRNPLRGSILHYSLKLGTYSDEEKIETYIIKIAKIRRKHRRLRAH